MKFAHISLLKKQDGGRGGVEEFGMYLKRAVPDMSLISFRDLPDWEAYSREPDFEKAKALNAWLLEDGVIGGLDSIVIVDGYWGLGLEGKVRRIISVVHGSYYGRFIQSQINPWGEVVDMRDVNAQFEMWSHPQVEIVCVALESQRELTKTGLHEENMRVIYHGVDLEAYKPSGSGSVWMHAATSPRKGLDVVEQLNLIDDIPHIHFMDERSGKPERKAKRLNQAVALVAPTRHEGNAYVLMEALACGIPLITYETGLACEMDRRCGLITDDLSTWNFMRLMGELDSKDYAPREWAEEMCDFNVFAAEWREYLGA